MKPRTRTRSSVRIGALVAAALAVAATVAGAAQAATAVKDYVEPVGDEYDIRALFA